MLVRGRRQAWQAFAWQQTRRPTVSRSLIKLRERRDLKYLEMIRNPHPLQDLRDLLIRQLGVKKGQLKGQLKGKLKWVGFGGCFDVSKAYFQLLNVPGIEFVRLAVLVGLFVQDTAKCLIPPKAAQSV